ncbi:hypothetical protein ACVMAJ_004807 [Bradyrhizobium sp. USDA 4448]
MLKAKPTSDRNSISGRLFRNAGQSRFRCGHENGSRIRNTPNQRIVVTVSGGTCAPTWRAITMLPAQNNELRLNSK